MYEAGGRIVRTTRCTFVIVYRQPRISLAFWAICQTVRFGDTVSPRAPIHRGLNNINVMG